MARPVLDLDLRAWQRTFGDITVIGTWILTTDRPCMVMIPTKTRPTHDRITPCAVLIDSAWMWDEATGDPAHAVQHSMAFAEAMGMNPHEPRNIARITSIIQDCLSDLLRIPPIPRSQTTEIVADAIATDRNTGKTIEAEVKDHV